MSASWASPALGGLAAVIVSMPPVMGAWEVGGAGIGMAFLMLIGTIAAVYFVRRSTTGNMRFWATIATAIVGYFVIRYFYDPCPLTPIESYRCRALRLSGWTRPADHLLLGRRRRLRGKPVPG